MPPRRLARGPGDASARRLGRRPPRIRWRQRYECGARRSSRRSPTEDSGSSRNPPLRPRDVEFGEGGALLRGDTFFEQGFVSMLMVAPSARGRGVGHRLLDAVAASCTTPKLFTSTNVSNQPMQRLLQRAGWSPVGLLHGLDEGDPELFYL
ncbi:GNAT family N-acetyltransferase [Streptomyces sp. NPDC086838]|uniref:GNAT family N-acetyltransferase n=1 Tax=Streptomyces sp. NPDC086838 TaxID=3365762 RepID=UPI0037F59367